MEITEKTFKTIEEKQIKPRPRWRFLAKNYSLWLLFFLSVIVGALAVSAILFMLTENDWDIYTYLGRSLIEHIFISMPYLWISILLILILFAYYNFRYTKSGYRYEIYRVIAGSVFISMLLGVFLFWFGLGEGIHNLFMQKVPFYDALIYTKKELWDHPQNGLLGGKITNIENENEFTLQDFNGKIWKIEKENPQCCDPRITQIDKEIELIGNPATDSIFFVRSVRPWHHR